MDAFTKASPQFIAAQKTCHRTGSAFEVFSPSKPFPKKTVGFLVIVLNCLIWVLVAGDISSRPGPTTYADAATSKYAAPNQYSATKGEHQ